MAEAGSMLDASGPIEQVHGFSHLQSNDALLNASAKFLLDVGTRLDGVIRVVEHTRKAQTGPLSWQWTGADDTTATATQGPLWSARQLLHVGLSATGTAVERLQLEVCALMCARFQLAAAATATATSHKSPEVRRLAGLLAGAGTEAELISFEDLQADSSATHSAEEEAPMEGPFSTECAEDAHQRLLLLQAELAEVHRQLAEKKAVVAEIVEKLRHTGHTAEAGQIEPLPEHFIFRGDGEMTEFQRWLVLQHVSSLAAKVSSKLTEDGGRDADAAVLGQAALHLQRGKEIDWELTSTQLGLLMAQLIVEGNNEAAGMVLPLQIMTHGAGVWIGDRGKGEREQLQAAVSGCAELGCLLKERGFGPLAAAIDSLSASRSFSRDKAAHARELARACLCEGEILSQPMTAPMPALKSPGAVLHDDNHSPVHQGLSVSFLESTSFLDRARQQLRQRIEAHGKSLDLNNLPLQTFPGEEQGTEFDHTTAQAISMISSYTPRDLEVSRDGLSQELTQEFSKLTRTWIPETPRTSYGDDVANVIQRLQLEGSDSANIFQRNERLKYRMHGIENRMDEINDYISQGAINKLGSLNDGIDRVSQKLWRDIEERETMEAEVSDMKQRMKDLRAKLGQLTSPAPSPVQDEAQSTTEAKAEVAK